MLAAVVVSFGASSDGIALALATVQATFPLAGSFNRRHSWMAMARPLVWGQFFFLTLAFVCLLQAFMTDDFSVAYVAQNANADLPLFAREGEPIEGGQGNEVPVILGQGQMLPDFEKGLTGIKAGDDKANDVAQHLNNLLLTFPNIPHESVPVGSDEEANELIREWGEKPQRPTPL